MTKKGYNKQLWGFIGLSVVVHGAIIGLLSNAIHIPTPDEQSQKDVTPLKAKLVFIPSPEQPPVESESQAQNEPEQGLPEPPQEKSEVVKVEQDPPARIEPPEVEQAVASNEIEPPEPEVRAPMAETVTQPVEPAEAQILTGTGTERNYPVNSRDLARQHLSGMQQQFQDQLAQESARAFRREQTSPTLRKPSAKPFMTEDEKYFESAKVRVDCSSTVNKSLAFLSTLAGGTLDCSKGSDLTPFIQNRINKLPEGMQKSQKDAQEGRSPNPR